LLLAFRWVLATLLVLAISRFRGSPLYTMTLTLHSAAHLVAMLFVGISAFATVVSVRRVKQKLDDRSEPKEAGS